MRSRTLPLVLCAVLVSGCTDDGEDEPAGADPAVVGVSAPGERLTVIGDADAVAAAVSTSRALFERSGVAVVAGADDRAGVLLGSSAAVGLGVPLLVVDGAAGGAVVGELDRLGAADVLVVGDAELTADEGGPEVLAVPATAAAVSEATGLDLGEADPVPADGDAAAVAALERDAPGGLRPEGEEPAAASVDGSLPPVEPAEPLDDVVVLATGDSPAGIATARAAGARVLLTGGATDPRASEDVVTALGDLPEDAAVVALGAGFAAEEGLDWKTATAATGDQLPGGGQLVFPGRLLVALYGHPGTGALGVMGEQPLDQAIARAQAHAAPYEPLVDATVVPTFEIIATVASSSAGDDGDYSAEAEVDFLRPWVEAAGEAGMFVVLDLQPGRTDFVTQAEMYRSLLELPHVGLALDPEWRLGPGEVHLRQIGSVDVEEVNRVVTWLADLTRENALPQKLLVLHQFRLDMLPGRERVDLDRDELAVMVHADGQGGQGDKQATWAALRRDAPEGLWWGWKNFYDEDLPMLTPEQTISDVEPDPHLISYQ
ncbi:hypothetical protein [Blastococcus saxobsidens]|uniref:Lipoprotein n=1 Tax=Blastococcus saxobsidens TaxID=138336 RepID=A0A4Q7Y4H4_9ACTN|nr:hypothetical protein [Blastococcus saxobsidens]RZU30785.1 hypothetical protein BKA19_0413 [Blastococcus saxobsidens]